MNTVNILGVAISNESKDQINKRLKEYLQSEKNHFIVTPNPEFVVRAQKDQEFRHILNGADMALADGVGLWFAAAFLGIKLQDRYTGLELVHNLIQLSEHNNYSIYLLGGKGDTADRLAEKLRKKHPRLRIVGAEEGLNSNRSIENNLDITARIKEAQPDILLVAFGSPKQEKWIAQHKSQLSSIKIAAGVGGVFNYMTGQSIMAPRWMKHIGLEWLWRLLTEPWRWKRIATATIIFPLLVIRKRLSNFFKKT